MTDVPFRYLPKQRSTVVGIGELAVLTGREGILVTYALGSCLGVSVWDPVTRVGGLLHAMLPEAPAGDLRETVSRYVDTGMEELLDRCRMAGGPTDRLVVKAAGGGSMSASTTDVFRIGQRNVESLERALFAHRIVLFASDLGGSCSRTMSLDVTTGAVRLKIDGKDEVL